MGSKYFIDDVSSPEPNPPTGKSLSIKQEKCRIIKNVIVVSVAFMLQFTAFKSMSVLQSSINKVDGLGTWSNTTIYAALLVSSLFLPSYTIKKLSVKWTMPACMFCYSIYIATQYYPVFYTIIPSGILVGIAAAPLWSAKCIYLTCLGEIYAKILSVNVEPILVRFFGIFFFIFRCSDVLGLLISSLILSNDKNVTMSETDINSCGINYCPGTTVQEKNFEAADLQLYALAGTYLCSSIAACLFVSVFLDPLTVFKMKATAKDNEKEDQSTFQLFTAALKHMITPYQALIIPLTIWSGLSKGFIISDFTAGFISCIFGVGDVGWVLIAYGLCSAFGSLSLGVISKYTGRLPLYILAASLNLTVIITLMKWNPQLNERWILFLLSGLSGGADAIWNTQNNSLYGVLFENNKEAAFSNYRLWESIGYLTAFILQTQLCIEIKLYLLLVMIGLGLMGYVCVEISERRIKKAAKVSPTT